MNQRVLLAGLFHETHTFLEGTTRLTDFEIRCGPELLSAEGDGSPLGGALAVAREAGWSVVPAIDMRAVPSAIVADEVVEHFWTALHEALVRALPAGLEGIYLVLHGAMAAESYPDVEGEILQRLQSALDGRTLPVCGVLDLHCNFSERMARHASGLVAYRENPHTDAEESARRGAWLLNRLMQSGERPVTRWRQPPVVWPPTGVSTLADPMRTLEQMARDIEAAHPQILAVNVFAGFAFADTHDTGVSYSGITVGDPELLEGELARLEDWTLAHKELGNVVDPPIESVMDRVLAEPHGPVLLVEPSDNIGGGAPGDGTGVLLALLRHHVQNAAVVINDPQSVADCRRAGIGGNVPLSIGGTGSLLTSGPAQLDCEVISLSDGRFELEDRHSHLASMYGIHIEMGPCAVVRHGGILLLLTSRKTPPFDLGQLRSQGIVPEELQVIGVKAAVAHRRAYDPIAKASYTVETPGPCTSDLRSFAYRRLRRPVYPLDE